MILGVPIIHFIIYYGVGLINFALIVRAIASWFGFDERFAIIRFCARLTDPFIVPIRRVIPPFGIFDMSFFVTFFFLTVMQILLIQALPPNW